MVIHNEIKLSNHIEYPVAICSNLHTTISSERKTYSVCIIIKESVG